MATEIASAYLALYAKMPGVQNDIARQIGAADVDKVGSDLGRRTGIGYTAGFAAAGAVAGLVATLAAGAGQALGDLVGDAVAASDATSKFQQTLDFAGIDTSTISQLQKSTKAYADETVYDLSTIQNATAQLAANGVKDYDKLVEAAGNLNAVAGGNASTFESVGMVLTQTAGAGKLTTENWNQLADAIPGASGIIQESLLKNGAYTGNFREAMEKGEISADEFNASLLELGSQPVAVEAAKSTETFEGAIGGLSATITGGLSSALNDIKPVLTGFINGVTAFVTFIQDNIDWIGPLAAGILIVATAVGIWTVAQWLLNVALTANPIGLIIVAIGLLIGAIILLVQNWDTVVKWITDVWGGFIGWITDGLNAFGEWWSAFWSNIGAIIATIWNTYIVNPIKNAINWLVNAISMGLQIINKMWNDTWNGLTGIVKGIWNGILGFIEGGVNGTVDLINGMIKGVNVVGGAFGVHIGLLPKVKIPRLENGGVVKATQGGILANIGEGRYDEAVVPLDPQMKNALGGRGARGDGALVIHGDVYTESPEEFAELVQQKKRRANALVGIGTGAIA